MKTCQHQKSAFAIENILRSKPSSHHTTQFCLDTFVYIVLIYGIKVLHISKIVLQIDQNWVAFCSAIPDMANTAKNIVRCFSDTSTFCLGNGNNFHEGKT